MSGANVTAPAVLHVQTTIGDAAAARALARAAVEARLAACGQVVGPVASVYRWQGVVESAEEWLVVFKTSAAAAGALQAFIRGAHPYDTPELIALPVVDGSRAYLTWILEQVDAGVDGGV